MKKIILVLLVNFLLMGIAQADTINLTAKSAILIDKATGKILYSQNENEKLPVASMTKIMSLLLIMEQIENGNLSLNDDVLVSSNAASMGGSQVYLEENAKYKVSELLKSVAMASANDSIVALAEKTFGTEENFVEKMNEKVQKLHLKNTNFVNVHGLDAENHYSSAYDMAIIAKELLKYDDILKYTSVYEDYMKKPNGEELWLVNTNKLIRFYDGVDGLKTGYTAGAGYCLTATAKKNDLRLISVVIGEQSIENRSLDTIKLLNYGFSNYKAKLVKSKDKSLGKIKVIKGKKDYVNIYMTEDVVVTTKNTDDNKNYSYKVNIDKIVAPVKKNTVVGKVQVISTNGEVINEINIIVKENLKKANLFDYILKNISRIVCFTK